MTALTALGVTVPLAAAYVLAIWLQRVSPIAIRCTTLEERVEALEAEAATLKREAEISSLVLDRLSNQRFGE